MLAAFLIGIIFGLFMVFMNFIGNEAFLFFSLGLVGMIFSFLFGAGYITVLLFTPQLEDIFPIGAIVLGVVSLIIWFIVGSIAGSIYGKIKKRT